MGQGESKGNSKGSAKVRDRVSACRQGGAIELNLEDCDLFKFPSQVLSLKSLECLNVSHNHIPVIPSELGKLSNLQLLKIGFNEIEELPPSIYRLKTKGLDIAFNLISVLPEGIEQMKNLEILSIGGNAIKTLPSNFHQLSNLQSFDYSNSRISEIDPQIFQTISLKELRLCQNQLLSIPENITKLSQLEVLDLGNNTINQVPPFINKLAFLKVLLLNNNQISQLPKTIAGLVRLEVFNCAYNQISDVSELDFTQMHQMVELRFNNNLLSQFNRGVGHMKRLAILDLTDNVITSLPREIGWLYDSMRQLLVSGNKLQRLPGDICFLNPTVKFELERNPLLDPFSMLLKNKYTITNIKPLCTTYFKAYPSNCIAIGDSVNKSVAGVGQRFIIEARDIAGNQRVNGKDNFRVFFSLENSDPNNPFTVNGIVKDLEDGTYQVAWNNKKAGFFYLHILNEGDHIRNSPFTHLVLSGPTNPANCKIQGGFTQDTPVIGVVNKFTIIACDQFDNEQTSGGEPFTVNIQGGNNPIPLLLDLQNGQYEVQWTPAWSATYYIEVGYDGFHITGSPFVVNI